MPSPLLTDIPEPAVIVRPFHTPPVVSDCIPLVFALTALLNAMLYHRPVTVVIEGYPYT
jgi:hypothetical protein